MPWQQDSETGEWVMVDAPSPPAMPLVVPAHPTDEGYDVGDYGVYPIMSSQMAPSRSSEGGYVQRDVRMTPPASLENKIGYQNEDPQIVDAWARGAVERGNEIRTTAVGTFEVDKAGRIVSTCPSAYRVN